MLLFLLWHYDHHSVPYVCVNWCSRAAITMFANDKWTFLSASLRRNRHQWDDDERYRHATYMYLSGKMFYTLVTIATVRSFDNGNRRSSWIVSYPIFHLFWKGFVSYRSLDEKVAKKVKERKFLKTIRLQVQLYFADNDAWPVSLCAFSSKCWLESCWWYVKCETLEFLGLIISLENKWMKCWKHFTPIISKKQEEYK